MINATSIDISRRLDIYTRFNEVFEKSINVLDGDGESFDFSDEDYTDARLYVYRTTDGKTPLLTAPVLELALGSGITLGDGIMTFTSTDPLRFTRPLYIYYLWLEKEGESKLWLNGQLHMNQGLYDGITETDEIIISPDGGEVTLIIKSGQMTGTEIIGALTDADIEELYSLLAPYINGEVEPGGPSDYIGTLYQRLLPYLTGEAQ